MLLINVKESERAKAIKSTALYLSVFPVKCIRKKSTLTPAKVIISARICAESEKSGRPPVMNIKVIRSMGRV